MAIQTPIKYNSINKKHETFDVTDTIDPQFITSIPLSSTAPVADVVTTGAVGVGTDAARSDHRHPFTHSLALTQAGGLVYTHNGDPKTVAIPSGTIAQTLGFNASGSPVYTAALGASVTIPASAFAVTASPTQAEVNTWLTANPQPAGAFIVYPNAGTAANPDYVWRVETATTTAEFESPLPCLSILTTITNCVVLTSATVTP